MLVAVATARAQQLPPPIVTGEPPLILRLEGKVANEHDAAGGFAQPSFEFHGRDADVRRWIGVEKAETIGDHPVLAKDVLEAVRPFRPNFIVPGPPDLIEKLVALPAGTPVTIEGLVDRAARTYLLRRVEPHDTPHP